MKASAQMSPPVDTMRSLHGRRLYSRIIFQVCSLAVDDGTLREALDFLRYGLMG
jgi:hypothetical protein